MPDAFRDGVRGDFSRLLAHWKTIELWIKRAEQVNKKAVIPAINELRYASRQIFQVVRLLEKESLSSIDEKIIQKRIIIAEQYLLNADHDVCDAVIGYFELNIEYLDMTYGISSIAMFYFEYPSMRERIKSCSALIAASRGEYDDRKKNYDELRSNHFSHIIDSHEKMLQAEVSAKAAKDETDRQLTIARSRIRLLEKIGLIGAICSIIAVPMSVYLWMVGPKAFCTAFSGYRLVDGACAYAAKYEPVAANTPSTDVKPDAPATPPQPSDIAPHLKPAGDPPAKQSRENKR
jgi:hypothetical protein